MITASTACCADQPPDQSALDLADSLPESCIEEGYREIGKALLIAETKYLGVGIPWIPPFSRRCRDYKNFAEGALDEFLKESLVAVKTKFLLCYLQDLEQLPAPTATDSLFLSIPRIDRVLFPTTVGICVLCLLLPLLLWAGIKISMAIILALFLSSYASYIACETIKDDYRKKSFAAVLEKEIDRRHGRSSANGPKVALIQVCE